MNALRRLPVGRTLFAITMLLLAGRPAVAQFVDGFEDGEMDGWTWASGDGEATIEMGAEDGYATVVVDATSDRYNIWWALIKREVGEALDLHALTTSERELRIEARIRLSHAPRRVNLHLNTQRTTDFHSHLMEFDIPDTSEWHVISMTTHDFDARPGDTVNAQLALMDWGRGRYRLDIDYFRVDVVDVTETVADRGEPLRYHPPIPPLDRFTHGVPATEAGMIDLQHPDVNLGRWRGGDGTPILTIDGTRYGLLRWDLTAFAGREVTSGGVLTLLTYDVQRGDYVLPELGQIRVVEIYGGDADWRAESVTYDRFTRGAPLEEIVNGQMIIDVEPAAERGDTTFVTISRPVLQRLIDGRTRGLLLRPLGPISASFFGSSGVGPVLHFGLEE